jgi:hypothetical protein
MWTITWAPWRFSGEIVAGFSGVSAKPIFYWLKEAIFSERNDLVDLPTNLSSQPDGTVQWLLQMSQYLDCTFTR